MNQHVSRAGRSERTPHGLTLRDPQPLTGIPAVWRFAALASTLLMGALATIGALYLGRSILLPVTAGLIVGITLSPAVQRRPFVTDTVIATDYDPSRMQGKLFIIPSFAFLRREVEQLVRRFGIPVL